MSRQQTLATSSNALQELAHAFYVAAKTASDRIKGNLRVEALQTSASVTERFWAYMEMGLDQKMIGDTPAMRLTAIAFTDRGDRKDEVVIGADMACFIRYDLPGLRWAKGFLGQSKLAKVYGIRQDGVPIVGLHSESDYDLMIQQCAAMGNISDESYVFFFSPESITVEKANNLLGDQGDSYPNKPWNNLHQFRDEPPVNLAQFYGALAACQLGETMLDKPAGGNGTVMDLVRSRNIETVLVLMVGTNPPQPPLRRDSPEIGALAAPVPESYWMWQDMLQKLITR